LRASASSRTPVRLSSSKKNVVRSSPVSAITKQVKNQAGVFVREESFQPQAFPPHSH
jgi:hypothetical protein